MGIYLNGTTAYTLYKSETVKPYFIDKTLMLEQLFPLVKKEIIIFALLGLEDLEKQLQQI